MSDNEQYRFGDDGKLERCEEEGQSKRLSDTGQPLGRFRTKGDYNAFLVVSALQKAIRRSDVELAGWCAWEMVRSGLGNWYWARISIIAIEELESTDQTILVVDTLEQNAKERWSVDGWEGIVCAIRAAIACARGTKSREHVNANRVFTAMKNEHIAAMEEGREPEYEFPSIPDEAYDQHTQAGRKQGRGFHHFMTRSSLLTNETEIGREWKEFLMQNVNTAYPDKDWDQSMVTEEDIKTALSLVEPGEHDDPERVNRTLDEVE